MRGSPLVRALVCWAVLLGLFPLVRKVTARDGNPHGLEQGHSEGADSGGKVESVVCMLEVNVTSPCRGFVLQHLGRELVSVQTVETFLERELKLEWPVEGVDFVVQLAWGSQGPGGGNQTVEAGAQKDAVQHAARIRLRMPDGRVEERTVWGRGEVEEVLSFGGKRE